MWESNDQNLTDKSTVSYFLQSYKVENSCQWGRRLKMLLWSRVRKPLGYGVAVFCWEMQANPDHAPHSQPHKNTAQSQPSTAHESTVGLTEAPCESYVTTPGLLSPGQ